MTLKNKTICVIGLGYVGLPLLIAFAKKYQVVGYDIDNCRIKNLICGLDTSLEIEDKLLESVKINIKYTSNIRDAKNCDIYIITVPTPTDKNNCPDLKALILASKTVGSVLKKENIVIYESTVYPGVTEDICVPELEKSSGLIYNEEFFCGYSPERINPGDKERTFSKILKVTSGSTPEIAKKVDLLYKEIIEAGTYLAPSIKVAEASKVIENTQRDVNIALVNEFARIFDLIGIDTNEVIEAAATKWNFIKFTPGLVGGHCIGIDPYYLTFKAEEIGYRPDLILAARQINNSMGKFIADKAIKLIIKAGKVIKDSNILVLGFTFKEDCSDTRNTRVLDIISELNDFGVNIDVYDPWIKSNVKFLTHETITNPLKSDKKYDCIVVAVAHKQFMKFTSFDYSSLSSGTEIILDIKNIVKTATWKL